MTKARVDMEVDIEEYLSGQTPEYLLQLFTLYLNRTRSPGGNNNWIIFNALREEILKRMEDRKTQSYDGLPTLANAASASGKG